MRWWNPIEWLWFRSNGPIQTARPSSANVYSLLSVPGSTSAGVYVNATTALNCSAWWSGIRLLSDAMGMLEPRVYAEGLQSSEEVAKHPVAKLLRRPSRAMTRFTFFQTLMHHVLAKGNFYGEILTGKSTGRAGEIAIMDPDDTEVFWDGEEKVYRSRSTGQTWRQGEIFHVPGLGFDGLRGLDVITFARQSLALDIAAENYGAGWFGSGGRPNATLTVPQKLTPEAADRVRAEYQQKHGPGSHNLMIAQDGATLDLHENDPSKSQAVEVRKHQVTVVARFLRVPPHMLYESGVQRVANLEQLGQEFLTYSLAPWMELIEQESEDKLLSESERDTMCVEFDESKLLRLAALTQMQLHTMAVNAGIETAAEARSDLGLPYIEGTDQLRTPLNFGKLNADGTVTNLGDGNPNGNGISNQNEVLQ